MDADPQDLQRNAPKRCGAGQRRGKAKPGPACPGDDRAARELFSGRRRPDPEMVLGERHCAVFERFDRALAVEPGWSDETVDTPADHAFDEGSSIGDPMRRMVAGKTEELAFARCRIARPNPFAETMMLRFVAMKIAVEEDFQPFVRPSAEARREGRAGNDRRIAPMIGHDEQRQPRSDVSAEEVAQAIDFALESRRDVMDRRQEEAIARHSSECGAATTAAPVDEQSFT